MVLTTYIEYRGKRKPISELSDTSRYKVDVLCGVCGETRNVYYRSVLKAGHTICLKCINKQNGKHLIEGSKYGRLTVITSSKNTGYSICRCECGNIIEKYNTYLLAGSVKSCGCLKKESFKNTRKVKGSEHGMWKGGVSSEREAHMSRKEYKDWRVAVYERDNYTCKKCSNKGHMLNAHHIESYKHSPEKRICVDNGITLCYECHMQFHAIYGKTNNREQIIEYINT